MANKDGFGITKHSDPRLQCSLRDNKSVTSRTSRRRQFRFGGSSDFGFHNPSSLFDLSAARSESPTTGFGIRSVSVGNGKGHRKSFWDS